MACIYRYRRQLLALIVALWMTANSGLLGTGITFQIINTRTGLPSNLVYDVAQSPEGLVWAVTGQGLCAFDGARIFIYGEGTIDGLAGLPLREIEIDAHNRIWLKDANGKIYHLDGHLNMHHYPFGPDTSMVQNFLTMENGAIDLMATDGHYRFDESSGEFRKLFDFEEPLYTSYLEIIERAYDGRFVIPANQQVMVYDATVGEVIFRYPLPRAEGGVFLTDTTILVSSRDFNILREVDIRNGNVLEHYGEQIYTRDPGLNTYYRKITRINEEMIGITSGFRGLFLLDPETRTFENYRHRPFVASSLSSDNAFVISKGRGDNFFVTTRTTGFNIPDMQGRNVTHIRSFLDVRKGNVFQGFVSGLKKDKEGVMWMGTQQGLLWYDLELDQASFIDLQTSDEEFQGVRDLYIDSNDFIWLGFSTSGILKLDENGKILAAFTKGANGAKRIPNDFIYEINEMPSGNIICTTSSDCFEINPNTNEVVSNPGAWWQDFKGKTIRHLNFIGNSRYVGTTRDGAYIFEGDSLVGHFHAGNGLSSNTISDIHEGPGGTIFIGTWNGLSIFNKSGSAGKYSLGRHYFNDRVLSIDEDAEGLLWIAFENAVYRFDPVAETFQKFDEKHGFKGGGFRLNGSYYDTESGILYYGTNQGVSFFSPVELSQSKKTLNPRIHALMIGDSILYPGAGDQIRVPYDLNTFLVDYHHIDLWHQPDLYYEFRMNKGSWQSVRTDPLVLENIPPGRFHLEMRASEDGKEWIAVPNHFMIHIGYPWWRTTWFYILICAISLFAIFRIYLILLRIRKVRKEKFETDVALHHNMQKVSEIEMKALRSQMNPHFMFNSLNSINSFILNNDPENASDYLTNFAQLMRVILENSRHEWVTLENELRAIRLYIEMEKLRFTNKFVYLEEISRDVQTDKIMIPPMLIQPFFENAIWHGLLPITDRICELSCRISKEQEFLQIEIRDNGIGKNAAQKNRSKFRTNKKSFGMRIIYERLEMINSRYGLDASVKVEDEADIGKAGQGTRVLIRMKIMSRQRLDSAMFEHVDASSDL